MGAQWTAASLATFDRERVKLECSGALIRAIWKAESIADLFDLYPPARDIAREWHTRPRLRELKRAAVNQAGGFHGVEYLGIYRPSGEHAFYCNAGDPYAATLVFIGRRLIVGDWGTLVERNQIEERGAE